MNYPIVSKCDNYALEVDSSGGTIRLHVWSIKDASLNLHIPLNDDGADSIAFRIGCELQEKELAAQKRG